MAVWGRQAGGGGEGEEEASRRRGSEGVRSEEKAELRQAEEWPNGNAQKEYRRLCEGPRNQLGIECDCTINTHTLSLTTNNALKSMMGEDRWICRINASSWDRSSPNISYQNWKYHLSTKAEFYQKRELIDPKSPMETVISLRSLVVSTLLLISPYYIYKKRGC